MSELFQLPPYFLVSLFQDWILLKEVVTLDSAFCSNETQAEFRHIITIEAPDPEQLRYNQLLVISMLSPLREMSVDKYYLDPKKTYQLKVLLSLEVEDILNSVIVSGLQSLTVSSYLGPMTVYTDPDNNSKIMSGDMRLLEHGGYAIQSFSRSDCWVKPDSVFLGWFDKDLFRSGFGTMFWRSSDFKCYTGKWDFGDIHGFGVMEYRNGDRYEGLWDTFANDGGGTMTYSHGQVQCGLWKDDQFYMGSSTCSDGRKCHIHIKVRDDENIARVYYKKLRVH
jgi:hypothetical protein